MLIEKIASAYLPTEKYADFDIHVFNDSAENKEQLALTCKLDPTTIPHIRIHSSCATGDIFGSLRCDCGKQLDHALKTIRDNGGILIYLQQEGRGIGLCNKIKAYALQEQGHNTLEANRLLGFPGDLRQYYAAAQIIKEFGFTNVKLLTNNPHKISELEKLGIAVERIPTPLFTNHHNENYLQTKKKEFGHLLG